MDSKPPISEKELAGMSDRAVIEALADAIIAQCAPTVWKYLPPRSRYLSQSKG
jgi:hypothetical protein